MSGPRPPHIQRRNGVYHLRLRVPDRLRERVGRQDICRSLQTYSATQARILANNVSAKVQEIFAVIAKNTNLSPQEARMHIQACFADIYREVDGHYPPVPETPFPDLELEEQVSLAEDYINRLTSERDLRLYTPGTKRAAETALARHGVDLKLIAPDSEIRLLDGFIRLLIEQQRLNLARLSDPLVEYQPNDPLFSNIEAHEPQVGAYEASNIGPSIRQAIDEYLSAKKLVWREKTHSARIVHLGYLAEYVGSDRRISEIQASDIRGFRNALTMLRSNHGRKRHLTFHERLTENIDAKIKNKTARLIFEPVKAFFRWAKEEEGLIALNPAADIRWQRISEPKAARTRRPFTEQELQTLFGSSLFTGSLSKSRRYQPGKLIICDAKFWVPIIGYYTGMRLGEIIQMHVSDVVLDVDIPYFDSNEKSGLGDKKHIKTAAGVRTVPIHPDLHAIGIADFVAERAKWSRPCKRLFSEIRLGSDGQASTEFSKLFARIMDKVGLPDPALTFHSFRHGAEDAFRNANLNQYTIDSIMGHCDGKVSSAYGERPSLSLKFQAVKAMKLPVRILGLIGQPEKSPVDGGAK